jgi:hypothetical protein
LGAKIGVGAGSLWLSPLLKTLAIGAAVAGGGLLYNGMSKPKTLPAPVAIVAPTDHASDPVPVATPKEEVRVEETVDPVVEPSVVAEPAPPKHAAVTKPSEGQLLSRAKALLSESPSKSLALLAQHERLYPDGVLAEEREVLKVRALQNTGRTDAAAKQAREFKKSHPDSVHHLPE